MLDEKLENNAGLRETVDLSKEAKDSQSCLITLVLGF